MPITLGGSLNSSGCVTGIGSAADPVRILVSPTGGLACLVDGFGVDESYIKDIVATEQGLSSVSITGNSLTGNGTAGSPLQVVVSSSGGVETIADGLAIDEGFIKDIITGENGLTSVSITGNNLTGDGTAGSPLQIVVSSSGGVETLADGLAIEEGFIKDVVQSVVSPTGGLEYLDSGLSIDESFVKDVIAADAGLTSVSVTGNSLTGDGTAGSPLQVVVSSSGGVETISDGLAVEEGFIKDIVQTMVSPTGGLEVLSDGFAIQESFIKDISTTNVILSPTGGLENRPDGLSINVHPSGGLELEDDGIKISNHDKYSIVVRGTGDDTVDNSNFADAVTQLNAWGKGTLWIDGEVYITDNHIFTAAINLRGMSSESKIKVNKVTSYGIIWLAPGSWPGSPSVAHYGGIKAYRGANYFEADSFSPSRGDWVLLYSYDEILEVQAHAHQQSLEGSNYPAELHRVSSVIGNKFYIEDAIIDNMVTQARAIALPEPLQNILVRDLKFEWAGGTQSAYTYSLAFRGCEGVSLENILFEQDGMGEIQFKYCMNISINGLSFPDNDAAEGVYSLQFGLCNGATVSNFHFGGGRHSIGTFSGFYTGSDRWGTPCNLIFSNGIINVPITQEPDVRVSISPHAEGANIKFHNILINVGTDVEALSYDDNLMTCTGALQRARYTEYDNCIFRGSSSASIGISVITSHLVIQNCIFEDLIDSITIAGDGMLDDPGRVCNNILIKNNLFKNCCRGIRVSYGYNVKVIDNVFEHVGFVLGGTPTIPKCCVNFARGHGHICTGNVMLRNDKYREIGINSGDGIFPVAGATVTGGTSGTRAIIHRVGSSGGDWDNNTGTCRLYSSIVYGLDFSSGEDMIIEGATGTYSSLYGQFGNYSVGIAKSYSGGYISTMSPCDLYVANNVVGGYGPNTVGFTGDDFGSRVKCFESAYRDKNNILTRPTLIDDDSTTIDVSDKDVLFLEYASGVTITAFTNGSDRQTITVITPSGGVTVQHNTTIQCFNDTDWVTYEDGGAAQFVYSSGDGYWSQLTDETY